MSHLGKKLIKIPKNVEVSLQPNQVVYIKGPLGSSLLRYTPHFNVELSTSTICITPIMQTSLSSPSIQKSKQVNALWGMYRTLLAQAVHGQSQGFTKKLEFVGVGYRAFMLDSKHLEIKAGYSQQMIYEIPKDVHVECLRPTLLLIYGTDKQRVSQVASNIRAFRKPEPFKGKGIRYVGEYIKLKEGKKK